MNKEKQTECPACKPSKIEFFHKDKKISEFTNPKCTECGGSGPEHKTENICPNQCIPCKGTGTNETTLKEFADIWFKKALELSDTTVEEDNQ